MTFLILLYFNVSIYHYLSFLHGDGNLRKQLLGSRKKLAKNREKNYQFDGQK